MAKRPAKSSERKRTSGFNLPQEEDPAKEGVANRTGKMDASGVDDVASQTRRTTERKGVLVRMPRELWRQLRIVAMDRDKTLQAIMVEAAQDYLEKQHASGSDG